MGKRAGHYTAYVADQICERIALGDTLEKALEHVGHLAPSMNSVWKWIDQHADFREKYERARQLQADTNADLMLQIAHDVLQSPRCQAAEYRVCIDVLKWQAEVRNRAKYGSKSEDPGKNKPLDPAKLRAEIKRLEAELGVAESKVVQIKAVK